MYLSVLHEHMLGDTRCYGNGRIRNVIVLLCLFVKEDHVQANVSSVVVFEGLIYYSIVFFTYISYNITQYNNKL